MAEPDETARDGEASRGEEAASDEEVARDDEPVRDDEAARDGMGAQEDEPVQTGEPAQVDDPAQFDAPDREDEAFWEQFETHEALMEATVWVLAESGYRGLTLRKVADRAGKNRGLVHYYFDSKDDLLRSLLDHVLEGTKRLMAIDEAADPREQLRSVLAFCAYGPGGVDEHGRHYYVAIEQLRALAVHDPDLRARLTRNYRYLVDVTTAIVEAGVEDGSFRPVDPEATAVFLLGAVEGARIQDLSLDVDTARETSLELIEGFV